jgi:hypothetical protein
MAKQVCNVAKGSVPYNISTHGSLKNASESAKCYINRLKIFPYTVID